MSTNIIPSDSPSIYAALSSLQEQALVLPNNVPPGGIAGFIFDIPQEETLQLESEITDHYVESNLTIQDQIALRPERIILRGLVAELTQNNLGAPTAQSALEDALPLISSYLPTLTAGALQFLQGQQTVQQGANAAVVGTAASLYQFFQNQQPGGASSVPSLSQLAVAAASSIVPGIVSGAIQLIPGQQLASSSISPQISAIGYFYQLWLGRMIFTIETPWGIMESMAIEMVRAVQPEDSPSVTELEVRFKKIRIVDDLIPPTPGMLAGRAASQFTETQPTQLGNIGLLDTTDQQEAKFINNWSTLR